MLFAKALRVIPLSCNMCSEGVRTNRICAWSSVVCECRKLGSMGVCNTLCVDFVSTGLGIAEVRCLGMNVNGVQHVVIKGFTFFSLRSKLNICTFLVLPSGKCDLAVCVCTSILTKYSWIGRPVRTHTKIICRETKRATTDLNIMYLQK